MVRPDIDKIRKICDTAEEKTLRQLGFEFALNVPHLLDYIDELEQRLYKN